MGPTQPISPSHVNVGRSLNSRRIKTTVPVVISTKSRTYLFTPPPLNSTIVRYPRKTYDAFKIPNCFYNFLRSSIPERNQKATMNSRLCLLTFILSSVVVSAAAALVGGWGPIKDLNDPHVKEIADFAVTEHNKAANASLKLQSVVHGEEQVVAGTNYKLVLEVMDGKAKKKFEVVVWEKPWQHFMNVTSFKAVKA
ncbi:Cysteine proteinase inhibitor 5 [Tripterygium wilfordii]|uniref:Cysteine proteinase inhibitor 5 n=1 Tax=Tripterygium wilfordii TaxID=458696 RepID=A0A7J7D6Y4_TRIWF|nr:cysteine proteinase inhibitor 1-like [Tripterygium wilfordii]KAF5742117.1 Cysteine proteinase inhibitor 5 [Tripterygium wilfordii]